MMMALRHIPIHAYLFLCLILGGASNGGFLANGILQLLGVALLVWAFWSPAQPKLGQSRKMLGAMLGAGCALIALQFVPIPDFLWRLAPARGELAMEGAVAGIQFAPKFWSLMPYESLKSLSWALPAIALATAMLRLPYWKPEHLAWTILAAMALSVIVATVQFTQGQNSPTYFYAITNRGSTVGFFANSNHLATLLLGSLPFLGALVARNRRGTDEEDVPFLILASGFLLLALVGIAVNGSLAGFGLVGPVLVAAICIPFASTKLRKLAVILLPILVLGGVGWLVFSDEGRTLLSLEELSSANGRQYIWSYTLAAIKEHFPLGSGLGTFTEVFARYEDPSLVTNKYINHAHNDYLELLLEFGVLVVPFLLVFLAWWSKRAFRIWTRIACNPFALAASVASATILVHSIVDYPLRTAAISSLFAASLVMMTLWIPGDGLSRLSHKSAR